jgi:MoaA/NifB/PqqE/SkfB family radical SAM enzyme
MDCVTPDGDPWCAYRIPGYSSNELFVSDAEVSKFGHSNPKRFMPTDRALALLDEMKEAGVRGLQFTGGGEPLLHPDHRRIMERALELGFKCSLVSNGLALTAEVKQLLTRFTWVRISIDAGTKETYSKTRTTHPDNYQKVLNNVRDISEAISESGSNCVLGIGFVVMPHNWVEIARGVLAAKTYGAHNIRFSAMFSPLDEKPYVRIYEAIKRDIANAKEYESEMFKVYDLFGDRIEDLRLGNPDYPICPKMHYCSYIGADMQVYMCCVYSYSERGKVVGNAGNLRHRRFDEFWNSEERKQWMQDFSPAQCERCQFGPSNRAMNALLSSEPPTHSEFP